VDHLDLDDLQKEIPLYAIISIGDIVLSRSLVVKKNLLESAQKAWERGYAGDYTIMEYPQ